MLSTVVKRIGKNRVLLWYFFYAGPDGEFRSRSPEDGSLEPVPKKPWKVFDRFRQKFEASGASAQERGEKGLFGLREVQSPQGKICKIHHTCPTCERFLQSPLKFFRTWPSVWSHRSCPGGHAGNATTGFRVRPCTDWMKGCWQAKRCSPNPRRDFMRRLRWNQCGSMSSSRHELLRFQELSFNQCLVILPLIPRTKYIHVHNLHNDTMWLQFWSPGFLAYLRSC